MEWCIEVIDGWEAISFGRTAPCVAIKRRIASIVKATWHEGAAYLDSYDTRGPYTVAHRTLGQSPRLATAVGGVCHEMHAGRDTCLPAPRAYNEHLNMDVFSVMAIFNILRPKLQNRCTVDTKYRCGSSYRLHNICVYTFASVDLCMLVYVPCACESQIKEIFGIIRYIGLSF